MHTHLRRNFLIYGLTALIGIAILAGLLFQASLLPPLEQIRAGCIKPRHQEQQESQYYSHRAGESLTTLYTSRAKPQGGSDEHSAPEVEQDCVVAGYTERLSAFTFWLVLATGVLGLATFMAAFAAWRAAEHIPTVERAYIFGGVGHGEPIRHAQMEEDIEKALNEGDHLIGRRWFLTLDNYGKTPGFVLRISLQLYPLPVPAIPPDPVWQEDAMVLGQTTATHGTVRRRYSLDTHSGTAEQLAYGQILYQDVLGETHFSSFAHYVAATGQRPASELTEYWKRY